MVVNVLKRLTFKRLATGKEPESCGYVREDVLEALTGLDAGQVLIPEIMLNPSADAFMLMRKATTEKSIWRDLSVLGGATDLVHVSYQSAREPGDPVVSRRCNAGGSRREVMRFRR